MTVDLTSRLCDHLFLFIEISTFSSQGETSVWIVSPRYEELADKYEKWSRDGRGWLQERSDDEGASAILFTRGENREFLVLIPDRSKLPEGRENDVIVEIQ